MIAIAGACCCSKPQRMAAMHLDILSCMDCIYHSAPAAVPMRLQALQQGHAKSHAGCSPMQAVPLNDAYRPAYSCKVGLQTCNGVADGDMDHVADDVCAHGHWRPQLDAKGNLQRQSDYLALKGLKSTVNCCSSQCPDSVILHAAWDI